VFNATFSNTSAISWRPVLVVEEAGVPGENHGQATGKLYHLRVLVESHAIDLYIIYNIIINMVMTFLTNQIAHSMQHSFVTLSLSRNHHFHWMVHRVTCM